MPTAENTQPDSYEYRNDPKVQKFIKGIDEDIEILKIRISDLIKRTAEMVNRQNSLNRIRNLVYLNPAVAEFLILTNEEEVECGVK